MVLADAHRPELPKALQVKRRVSRVGFEELEVLVGDCADGLRQRVIQRPKSGRMPCASKGAGFSCPVVGHRLFDEAVKFPRCRVCFDLTIPNLGVELSKPLPELRKRGH